jgi:hypothetical protein
MIKVYYYFHLQILICIINAENYRTLSLILQNIMMRMCKLISICYVISIENDLQQTIINKIQMLFLKL